MHMQLHIFRLRDRQPKLMRFLYDDTFSRRALDGSRSIGSDDCGVGTGIGVNGSGNSSVSGKSEGEYAWTLNVTIDNEVVLRHKHLGVLLSRTFLQRYLLDCIHSLGVNAHLDTPTTFGARTLTGTCTGASNVRSAACLDASDMRRLCDNDGDTTMCQQNQSSQQVSEKQIAQSGLLASKHAVPLTCADTPVLFGCDLDVQTIAAALAAAILAGRNSNWTEGACATRSDH